MKNLIIIDIDTDRTSKKINFGKDSSFVAPETEEDTKIVVTNDIACICEALCELIHISAQNGYVDKKQMINASIENLKTLLD